MKKNTIIWAALFGTIAISLGALGAHGLKPHLSPDSLESFKTAIRYQVWHALALLILGFTTQKFPLKNVVVNLWITGVCLFSFSIYLLSTSSITGLSVKFLGPITPLGGLLMIGGWIILIVGLLKQSPSENQ